MKIRVPKGASDTHMHFYDQAVPGAPGTFLPGHFPVRAIARCRSGWASSAWSSCSPTPTGTTTA